MNTFTSHDHLEDEETVVETSPLGARLGLLLVAVSGIAVYGGLALYLLR